KLAASQNTVVPPFPSTISHPSGRPNSSVSPARTDPTTFFTAGWRCEVPITSEPLPGSPAETRACNCSGRTLEGPQPNRPSAGRIAGSSVIWGVSVTSADRTGAAVTGPLPVPSRQVASAGVNRVSARLAAIAPSATLAVDAKAKALQAAG